MRSAFFIQHKKKFFATVALVTAASAGLVFSLPDAPASAEVLVGATETTGSANSLGTADASGAAAAATTAVSSTASTEPADPADPVEPVESVDPADPVDPAVPEVPAVPVTPPTETTDPTAPTTDPTPAPVAVKHGRRRTIVQRPTTLRKISSGFGSRRAPCWGCSRYHAGVDITPGYGAKVVSIANGVVIRAGRSGRMGVNTAIRHVVNGKVVVSVYEHLQRGSLRFRVGQRVKHGQRIGRVGNTGSSTGAHLHFEIRTASGRAINPLKWLRKNLHR